MTRRQHLGWFFSRGFGPQGWGRPDWDWQWDWRGPALYQQSARELEQAGFELIVAEDAPSLGGADTIDLRIREAYGGPKHDPLMLAPYLLAATARIGVVPTINAGLTPPYLAARQLASLHHLSGHRAGVNVVTDVRSARHVGAEELAHADAYARAEEWIAAVRALWRSWGEDALVEDAETGRFADASRLDPVRIEGEHVRLEGPLNAVPFEHGEPVVVSPGGSDAGLGFAGRHSHVQLALARLDVDAVRAYRARVHEAATAAGRDPSEVKVLLVLKPEIVASDAEVDRIVEASRTPSDDELRTVLAGQSSDLETDLVSLPLDEPLDAAVFGQHVSKGSIAGLLGPFDRFEDATLRELATAKAVKGALRDRAGLVGTAHDVADFIEQLGDEADNDGFLLSGDLHPVTVHRMLDDLVPILRRRGILRRSWPDAPGVLASLADR